MANAMVTLRLDMVCGTHIQHIVFQEMFTGLLGAGLSLVRII